LSRWLRFRIRWLDRPAAFLLLVTLSPAMLLIALLILLNDGPPVFVFLDRSGCNGELFKMMKFRTMHQLRGAKRAAGSPLTSGADRRITPVGRHLRRHRLDEFPQLLNVLHGDMALIGPRPETPEFVDITDARWAAVLSTPPGIAGPTQVFAHRWEANLPHGAEGRVHYADVLLPAKLAMDQWYVDRASPRIDLNTFLALLPGRASIRATSYLESVAPFPGDGLTRWSPA
jgi:lipopolysaccharide/colanic/teichoic acid biosynthesis glycosyltransferase